MDIHLPVDNTDIDSGYEAIQAKKKADVGKAAASRLRAIREEETPKKGMRPSMKFINGRGENIQAARRHSIAASLLETGKSAVRPLSRIWSD